MPRKASALAKASDWLRASPEELEKIERYRKEGPDIERILKETKESLPGFSPGAGIIKPMAAAKILAKGGGEKAWPWLRGILRAPQQELSRIQKLSLEHKPGVFGQYIQGSATPRTILLSKIAPPKESTVWHELTHARQYDPWEKFSGGERIRDLSKALNKALKRRGYLPQERYLKDPLETHARAMERIAGGPLRGVKPQEYDELFERLLEESMEKGTRELERLLI